MKKSSLLSLNEKLNAKDNVSPQLVRPDEKRVPFARLLGLLLKAPWKAALWQQMLMKSFGSKQ